MVAVLAVAVLAVAVLARRAVAVLAAALARGGGAGVRRGVVVAALICWALPGFRYRSPVSSTPSSAARAAAARRVGAPSLPSTAAT